MKRGILLIFTIITTLNTFCQTIDFSKFNYLQKKEPFVLSNSQKRNLNKLNTRSFNESYFLNYANTENALAGTNGGANPLYVTFMKLNQNFTKVQFASLSDLCQIVGANGDIYNIFGFNTNTKHYVINTVDLSKTNLILDSFKFGFKHTRVNNSSPDTLIVSIYDQSNVTVPKTVTTGTYPNWTSTSVTYSGTPLFTDMLILNSQSPINDTIPFTTPFYYTNKLYTPNLTLPAGKSFALRVQFKGDTANYINPLFTARDDCNNTCLQSPAYIFNTTGFLNLTFNKGTANEIPYNGTMNTQGVFFYCQNKETCDYWDAQNLDVSYFVHSNTAFNVKIDPVKSNFGCSTSPTNNSIPLGGSYSGLDTNATVVLSWKAIGGSKFDNGMDTITAGGTTYNFDNTGGYEYLILKGVASTGEIAYDTLVLLNLSMQPTITSTGTLSCKPTDFATLSITNSAAVGFNSAVLAYYAAVSTKNLSGNLNYLNGTMGITYSWNGGTTRTDTTYITVNTPGTYTVNITNYLGCTASATKVMTLSSGSTNTINFTYSPTTVCANKDIVFTNTSTKTSNWNFKWINGVDTIGTSQDLTKSFATAGNTSVILAGDSAGCRFTKSQAITVLSSTDSKCKSSIATTSLDQAVKFYPNPTRNGIITIDNASNSAIEVKITDILGKTIFSESAIMHSKEIDLTKATNGVYFIEIENKGQRITKKLVVNKED